MITLIQAFRLCDIRDDEIIYLRDSATSYAYYSNYNIYTGKEIRDKYDMKHTSVVRIRPRFSFGEFEGMEFTIRRQE